jgi:hypothetical protein
MIKIENKMLVLDSTFTKEDVRAIDEFVNINIDKERERIIALLHDYGTMNYISEQVYADLVEVIKNSGHTKDAS